MSGTDGIKSFETLDVQVKALEGDVRDIKTSIASLGAEVRQALTNVTSQFALQQRTPWMSIGSIGAVLIAVLSFIGSQALTPILSDIKILKEEVVPRVEHNFRQDAINRQFDEVNKRLDQSGNRKYDELTKTIDQLRDENRSLRSKN